MAATTVRGDRYMGDESSIVSVLRLILKGTFKASELVKREEYEWFDDSITDERFPLRQHAPVDRTIELFEFDHDPSDDEVLEELKRRDLERPTYEDALYFGIKYHEEQRRPIVFFHEPVLGPDGLCRVLVLYEGANGRRLSLDWFGYGWVRFYIFAGVRK